MGIQGLLSFLKNSDENVSAIKPSHLSDFRGKKAAVDAYSWLHKGIFSCAQDLFMNKPTTKYVDYCLKNIKLLQDNGITPVLVFDGGKMPFKVVEQKRRDDRQKAKQGADDLIAAGRMNEAYMQMVQSINITHEMASNLIKAARKIGVESVVAPYEADAQLVYLEKEGLVDFIISEDSDLIIFGAQKIFLKMAPSGHGDLFDADCVELCLQANKRLKGKFQPEKLLLSAILSGCDYLKNIPGVGLIKAWKFMNMTENSNIRQFLKKIPSYLKLSVTIEDEYIEGFVMAWLAFQHQLVFDTRQKKRVPLKALNDEVSKEDYTNFLNKFAAVELDHLQLALGNIDYKKRHYDDYNPHMLSYLYYAGNGVKNELKESPIIGFNTEGIYKRTRQSKAKTRRSSSLENLEGNDEDQDLADYYKNMDTSPRKPLIKKEEPPVEPPRKRIKCKFFKYKINEDDNQDEVQSRFFKSKDDCDVDMKSEKQEEPTLENGNIDKENKLEVPNKDIPLKDSQENKKVLDIKINNSDADLKQVFREAGVDIDSENSNDQEIKQSEQTPVKIVEEELIEVIPDIPESPIITSQGDRIKPKLKEIQNVQKFAKAKRKVLPKNQPTLLGFFTKL